MEYLLFCCLILSYFQFSSMLNSICFECNVAIAFEKQIILFFQHSHHCLLFLKKYVQSGVLQNRSQYSFQAIPDKTSSCMRLVHNSSTEIQGLQSNYTRKKQKTSTYIVKLIQSLCDFHLSTRNLLMQKIVHNSCLTPIF